MEVLTGAIEAEREVGLEIAIDATLDETGMVTIVTEVITTEVAGWEDLDQNLLVTIDIIDLA